MTETEWEEKLEEVQKHSEHWYGMYKNLEAENTELKAQNKELREKVHWWKKEVNVAHRSRADEMDKLYIDNNALKAKVDKIKNYLAYNIPHELINAATNEIWKML